MGFTHIRSDGMPQQGQGIRSERRTKRADKEVGMEPVGSNALEVSHSNDPDRDNCFICAQNGQIGYPVSRKIQLPANWEERLREAMRK